MAIALVFRGREPGDPDFVRTIWLRRSRAEVWEDHNPILLDREPGVEIDFGNLKIGDGKTAWNDLPYATPDEALELLVNAWPRNAGV